MHHQIRSGGPVKRQLTPELVQHYHDHLVISGHSPRTIHGYLRYLSRLDNELGALDCDRHAVVHWLAHPSWSAATCGSLTSAVPSPAVPC